VTKALIIAFFVLQTLIFLSSAFGDYSDRTFSDIYKLIRGLSAGYRGVSK
jgi:hypothetical protein